VLLCALSASAVAVSEVKSGNSAPITQNMEISTFKNVAVGGQLEAMDPDGDLMVFLITGEPKKGTVDLSQDGSYTYTPYADKKGRDSFTFAAVDSFGNRSDNATVNINIQKQATRITYSDLDGDPVLYHALRLAEADVFTGDRLGGEYFFRPEQPVSRGEFLVMCMEACGADPLKGVTRTGFYDDADIPPWEKPYVAAALLEGKVSGYTDGTGRPIFLSECAITNAEASVLLNSVLDVTDVSYGSADEACPAWAVQASLNLSACDIPSSSFHDSPLTRGDAAKMLSAAMDVAAKRKS